MSSRVRRPAAALAGLAASFGLAAMAPAVAAPAGPPVPLVKQDVGGAELASPGIVVHYPAKGAVPLPQVPASAYVIADANTGQVLAAQDAHGLFPPASTLKMLTAITLIPRLNPNATVLASTLAAQTAEYDVGLVAGRRYKVSDLFRALLLISANDAAVALTQATGSLAKGMALINAEAHNLQAYDVVAKQPNGLPANGQVVSAYDEALIARQALATPAFMKYDSTISAQFPVTPQQQVPLVNQNSLLTQYPGGIGGKIGWTEAAEATYIGMARRGGVTLIVTVLHCTSLQEITSGEKLLNWGFAMDGRVRPVGQLVSPLHAVATSYASSGSAATAAGLARPHDATRAGRLADTRAADAEPAAPSVPTVPLAVGGGLLAIAAIGAGWLARRRKQPRRDQIQREPGR
ncbi:MAG TPA: D-alanyl-D-alanine carboxypeptidase [Streptosporangiaceae bacterium]|nr:D-alanyl-D-alanine carboxypeptidase [Streptosporangiaceae bacterium]